MAACRGDETISGHSDPNITWELVGFPGGTLPAATISFPKEGVVLGQGPCNAFRGTQTAPYPWIDIGDVTSTRRACPELASEAVFHQALAAANLVEVSGDVLILTGPAGEMVFKRVPADP